MPFWQLLPVFCTLKEFIVSPQKRDALSTVRVRFAPSPTGYLHVGGLRTALYNFLYARKMGGSFLLRIEDTDRARYVEGAVENLVQSLAWAGLRYDEGPGKEGNVGPYVQSERLALYRTHVDQLLKSGNAYYAFDTPEELDAMRKEQEQRRLSPKYDRRALKLTPEEIEHKLGEGRPYVVRLKVPEAETIAFDDCVRGRVEFSGVQIDDQVLLKSDGYPTYHLANVVDDHIMGITHVIRGEEWLSSTPKHVLLYRFFGWDLPVFAHLPLLLNADKSKLSKRQGDVSVEDYRLKGYLPEALVNFVALLGWNPGDEREVFSLDQLVKDFSLERVGKAGAVFNIEKLDWLNSQHLRSKSDEALLGLVKEQLAASVYAGGTYADDYLLAIIAAMKERASFARDFVDKCPYFYAPPEQYEEEGMRKRWKKETAGHLSALIEEFSILENPSKADFESALHRVADSLTIKPSELIHPLRLALSGMSAGPGLYDIIAIVGKDETLRRMTTSLTRIP